jgi:hypothetical protein
MAAYPHALAMDARRINELSKEVESKGVGTEGPLSFFFPLHTKASQLDKKAVILF